MSNFGFDAFGEAIDDSASGARQASDAREAGWLQRVGTSAFWTLVIAIVVARAIYFEDGSFNFERIASLLQGLFAAI